MAASCQEEACHEACQAVPCQVAPCLEERLDAPLFLQGVEVVAPQFLEAASPQGLAVVLPLAHQHASVLLMDLGLMT